MIFDLLKNTLSKIGKTLENTFDKGIDFATEKMQKAGSKIEDISNSAGEKIPGLEKVSQKMSDFTEKAVNKGIDIISSNPLSSDKKEEKTENGSQNIPGTFRPNKKTPTLE